MNSVCNPFHSPHFALIEPDSGKIMYRHNFKNDGVYSQPINIFRLWNKPGKIEHLNMEFESKTDLCANKMGSF
jgi:hypothetical protein